jgi:hypothetical protein
MRERDSTVFNGDLEFDRKNVWDRGMRVPARYELKAIHILRFLHVCHVSNLSHSPTYLILLRSGKIYKIRYEPH